MKILVQWSLKNPHDWEEIDSSEWVNLPKKPKPNKGEGGKDNVKGWIANVMVQGITTEGYDHVAIEPYVIGFDEGVKLTVWNDDPEDWPVGQRNAIVWTILPLAPDPRLGMAINTRQSCVRYCEGDKYDRLLAHSPQNTTVRPWDEFVKPEEQKIRHGVWLSQEKWEEHKQAAPQSKWGWMHWVDHLPESELERDKLGRLVLKEQRKQGRYKQAEHTITYYQRDTNRANAFLAGGIEDALELTTASSVTESQTTDSGSSTWVFTTDTNQPNVADWPSGNYRAQYNVNAASAGLVYGTNNFYEFDSTTASLIANVFVTNGNGDTNDFSGTGLKLSSMSWDPAAGSAGDRFAFIFQATGDSHGDAITLTLNTTDSFGDGPWTSGGSASISPSPSVSVSLSISPSPSASVSPSSSVSPSPSLSISPSPSASVSPSSSVSLSNSPSPSFSISLSPSLSPSVSMSPSSSVSASVSPSLSVSLSPSMSPSRSPSVSPSPSLEIPRAYIYQVNQTLNRSYTY